MTAQISRPPPPKMTLGVHYGDEDLTTEFKEFYFKICPSTKFSNDEILYFLESKKMNIDLSRFVLKNLKYYIKIYLARYMSCFMNGKINGQLYFGINDWGIVTGIPSTIEIDEEVIQKIVDRNLFNYCRTDSDFTYWDVERWTEKGIFNHLSKKKLTEIMNDPQQALVELVDIIITKGIFTHLNEKRLKKIKDDPHLAFVELIKKHVTFSVVEPDIDPDAIEINDLPE